MDKKELRLRRREELLSNIFRRFQNSIKLDAVFEAEVLAMAKEHNQLVEGEADQLNIDELKQFIAETKMTRERETLLWEQLTSAREQRLALGTWTAEDEEMYQSLKKNHN
jgi:CRISPR/Cas system-associated endoribonuclease Cas2